MKRTKKTTVAERARWRSALLLVGFAACAAALEGRILYLQLVDKDFLAEQANDRHLRTVQISAHRGSLTDRFGEPLAVSTPIDTIYANPQELKPELDRLGELAALLDQDEEWLARRITSNLGREFVFLARHVLPAKAQQVLELGLPGVGTVREYRRYYPAGEVAGHIVGFTDIDDRGQEGLEAEFDHWLKGELGSKRVIQDRRGQIFSDVELLQAARPGRDLRTSIDLRLQYLAYRELKAAVADSRARSGSVVVLDPRTGEVLAMANQPSYNPNDRGQYRPENYRNRAITDMFEPGSSFKPFVLAAALESGAFNPRSVIDTSPGKLTINDRIITEDTSNLGRVDLTTVLAKSSNVGAARVALTMEPQAIAATLSGFGIGRLTDSAFPGETAGVLTDPHHWRTINQATVSYGYGVAVSTLQLARAYAAIAADGTLRPVSLLALDQTPPGERVISAATTNNLTHMLEAVVTEGTGGRAAIRNFHVAGKSGTTRKAGVGGYDAERHGAIFAGFAPATDPRLVVVVMIDEPQGDQYYGGEIAAPVFANIVSGALRVLAVPPDALATPSLTVVAQARVRP